MLVRRPLIRGGLHSCGILECILHWPFGSVKCWLWGFSTKGRIKHLLFVQFRYLSIAFYPLSLSLLLLIAMLGLILFFFFFSESVKRGELNMLTLLRF